MIDERELGLAARSLPAVGREAILADLEHRSPRQVIEPVGLLAQRYPVFVTLRIEERLRGCIGSLAPLRANLVEETMDRACAAAFHDPRFPRLQLPELGHATIEVSILGALEPVASLDDLDPARFGIEVRDAGDRRAVLLPEIPGVETVDQQIAVTREKAGIAPYAEITIRRFGVVKVLEESQRRFR